MLKRKEKIKTLLGINIIIIVIAIIILSNIFIMEHKKNREIVNHHINAIIGNIVYHYPEVNEEELIQILNDDKKIDRGEELLKKYGITDDRIMINAPHKEQQQELWIYIFILIFLGLSLIITFIVYLIKRDKKIKELTNYINQLNQKNYSFDIEDNGEGELSNLKNELYKITVTLKEQAELFKKEKNALSDSVSDISHQLKTPLTSMMIMLDNLQNEEDMDVDVRRDFIKDIIHQVGWIHFLVISMLKLARFDAGVITFKEEKINVDSLLQEVINNVSILLDLKEQKIVINGEKNCCFKGDFHWQMEALTNILKNGIEHSYQGDKIEIEYAENAVYTKIIIRDFGMGMDREDVKNIFKRYYKGKNSSDSSIGIGLSLAKTIIEKGNGYITCHSELKKGTTFEIRYMK